MTSEGRIREWHDDEGWGVIDSPVTPGGCWAHFSSVLMPGYKSLEPEQEVSFSFEEVGQDGYSFRAVEVWPSGQTPVRDDPQISGNSSAFHSTLTLSFDDEDETTPSSGPPPSP